MTKTTIYGLLGFAIFYMLIQCTSDGKTSERSQSDLSTVSDRTVHFNAPILGWSFEYPADWKVVKEDVVQQEKKVDETDRAKPLKGKKNIIFIEKSRINFFTADLAPYDSRAYGSYSDVLKNTDEQLINMFKSGRYPFEYRIGQATIDSLTFHRFEVTVFTSGRSDTLFNQVYLTRLMNDSISLAINLSYNNESAKEALYDIIESSEFK